MAEQKDTLAELRRLAETVLKVSALDAAGIDAYMAYAYALEARTVLQLLAVIEAAKEQPHKHPKLSAALAALEGEKERGGR